MSKSDRVLLGEITGVHGIKGEVVIRSYAADPEDIAAYGRLQDHAGTRTFDVLPVRVGPKGVVARIAGIEDRTSAERLRGTKLYVTRAMLPVPGDRSFYFMDLIGLKAIGGDGNAFGRVTAVHNFGAGDIIEVSVDGHPGSELVPFADAYVPDVNIADGWVRVLLPASTSEEDEPEAGEPLPAGTHEKSE
ncbi:MAG: ribosome maturation factor RimM [Hyphomicrobiaceae bacterium]|nr:ribosome maturation factor RimM [Hyphomicrobiaceae bacterium]